jgi:hypothetical protein
MKQVNWRIWLALAIGMLMLLLAACGGSAEEPAAGGTRPAQTTVQAVTPVPMDLQDVTVETGDGESPSEMPEPGLPDPQAFMADQVTTDLADRLGTAPDAISVVSVEEREWSDAALGCPAPDQVYAQVVTPGFEITLSTAEETYKYHTDTEGSFVLCGEDGQPVSEGS